MTSENHSLRETLDRLQHQLAEAKNIDEALAERLRTTIADAKAALDKRDTADEAHHERKEWLNEAAEHFEQSHPTIAGTINRLVDILGQAGI